MSLYVPVEDEARQMYVMARRSMHNHLRESYGAEFDRFLTRVKAAAWAEGFDAGERDVMEHERTDWDRDCIPNPYREGEDDE